MDKPITKVMNNLVIPGHGFWFPLGQINQLDGESINPDITKELVVGDVVRVFHYSVYLFCFFKHFTNPNYHTCSLSGRNYSLIGSARGFVTKVYKHQHTDAMSFPKNPVVTTHNQFYYIAEVVVCDGVDVVNLKINSRSLSDFLFYKWVPDPTV